MAARASRRIAEAERAAQDQAAKKATHEWTKCGSIWRCSRCHCRMAKQLSECHGRPANLADWQHSAQQLGQVLYQGELFSPSRPATTVRLLACKACGAWATAATQQARSLLLRPCSRRPTKQGLEARRRLARGLHPKRGLEPPLLRRWQPREEATSQTPPAARSPAQCRLDALRARVARRTAAAPEQQ